MPKIHSIEPLEVRIAPATLNVVNGVLTYSAGNIFANDLTVAVVGSNYTFSDSDIINLGDGALAAGFTGNGTNAVLGPDLAVTSIVIALGALDDELTLNGLNDPLTFEGGSGSDTALLAALNTNANGNVSVSAETITVNALVGADNLTLNVDSLNVVNIVNAATSITVAPITAGRPIRLGGEAANELSLGLTEIPRLTAPKLTFGNKIAGNIVVVGTPDFNADVLSLKTGGGVTVSAGFGLIVDSLAIDADATVNLALGTSDFDTLAVRVTDPGADLLILEGSGFVIGTVDGIVGLSVDDANGAFISIQAVGDVSQAPLTPIRGFGLQLLGSANFFLPDAGNEIDTIAANLSGPLTFSDSTSLVVGLVNGTDGVTATGGAAVNLSTLGGNLVVNNASGSPQPDIVAGSIFLTALGPFGTDFGITLAPNAGISASVSIRLLADSLSLGAAVNAPSEVTILPAHGDTVIVLGGADAPATLGLAESELDFINTDRLTVGALSIPITVATSISPVAVDQLVLKASTISGPGGIVNPALEIESTGSISLDGANNVATLKLVDGPGPISFRDSNGFQLISSFNQKPNTVATFDTDTVINFTGDWFPDLTGNTPGTDQNQIVIFGGVTLSGVFEPFAFAPLPAGTDFILISNDGTDPVTGTFAGLPEGAPITVGSTRGTITYVGGDGNDVVFQSFPGIEVTLSNGGKTATYRDIDGDLVTVKTTKGAFDGSEFIGIATTPANGGQLERLILDADFTGASITFTAKRTADGGNGFVNVGFVDATNVNLGAVTIPGDLGRIRAGDGSNVPALKALTVQSMGLLGVSTQGPGNSLSSAMNGDLSKLVVKHDVRSILLNTNGLLGSVTVGGSFVGAAFTNTKGMGAIKIGGDLRAGVLASSVGPIASLTVGGSILGLASSNPVIVTAHGKFVAPTAGPDVAIGSVKVTGSVENTFFGAGTPALAFPLTQANADASIGSIIVGRDWVASSAVAGVDGLAEGPGNNNDVKVASSDRPEVLSAIGSFTVKGQAFGTPFTTIDMFGVVAERIGKAKVGLRTFAFKADTATVQNREAFFAATTVGSAIGENPRFDFTIRELGSTTPSGFLSNVNFSLSSDGKTVVYTDSDGDVVTVKRSAGAFVPADFDFITTPTGVNLLEELTITPGPTSAPVNLSVTAKPGPEGGNGFVNIGRLNAGLVDLGTVLVTGEVARISAGDNDPAKPGLGSAVIHSLGNRAGIISASPIVSATHGINALTVKTDVHDVDISSDGNLRSVTIGGSFLNNSVLITIGAAGIGTVKIGGSVLGNSAIQSALAIGSISIGGDLVSASNVLPAIQAFGQAAIPAKGLDVAIKSLTVKGSVDAVRIVAGFGTNADASIGAISVGRSWIASSVLAGTTVGADGFAGNSDDAKATNGRDEGRFSTIASILIGGQAIGTAAATDAFGITAEQIVKAKIGSVVFKFDKGERDAADAFAAAPTGPGATGLVSDFFIREVTL